MFRLSQSLSIALLPLALSACVSPEPQRGNSCFDRPTGSPAATVYDQTGVAFATRAPTAGAVATGTGAPLQAAAGPFVAKPVSPTPRPIS